MHLLDLGSKKVTKGTAESIALFVYSNRTQISLELAAFYQSVKSMIEGQLNKPAAQRMSMTEILERMYNIDQYILNSGAAEVTTEFISI